MKKKHKIVSILAVVTMLVSIITISTVNVSAEQQGDIAIKYNHTDLAANGGGTMQDANIPGSIGQLKEQNNVKTGDNTAYIAGGLAVAAILSACTVGFTFKRKKKED